MIRVQTAGLLVCISNEGADDLRVLRVYRRLADARAKSHAMVRIVDESGDDYLYPESLFTELPLPPALEQQLESLAAQLART